MLSKNKCDKEKDKIVNIILKLKKNLQYDLYDYHVAI
jgi:hypothetical protein